MTIRVGNPGISELGTAIVQRAIEVGRLRQVIINCQIDVILDPGKETLSRSLVGIFNLIKEQTRECEAMRREVSTLQGYLPPFYANQSQLIIDSFKHSEGLALRLVQPVFDAQCQFIEIRFKEIIEKLNIFRKRPSDEQLVNIEQLNLSLFSRIKKISKLGSQYVKFSPNEQKRIDALKETSVRFGDLINFQKPGHFGYLFACLKKACEYPDQLDQAFLQKLDQQLESMPNEFVQKLDEMLCEHALVSKSDILWNKSHRYDDINFFKCALTTAMIQGYERLMLDGVSQEDLDLIYQEVFVRALGPKDQDYKNWVKSEFPSLINLVEAVYNEFLLKKEVTSLNQSPPDGSYSPLSQSSGYTSDAERRVDFAFYGPMTEKNIIRHISENSKVKQLQSLIDKIDLIEEQAKRNLKNINQFTLKQAIIGTLSEDLLRSLFGMISFISPEERLGEGWGQRHCTDNISRLRRAIYNLFY